MSLKKALTKIGLVEEDVVPSPPPRTKPSYVVPVVPSTPTISEEVSRTLQKSLQDNKLSGFDYLKFISTVEEMSTYGMPEEARYKMAFMAAKQVGVDKDALLKSGSHYLTVLSHDEEAFNSECERYEKDEVKTKEARVAELQATLVSLQQKLQETIQEQTRLTAEVQEKSKMLAEKRASFQSTLQSFTSMIQSNLKKINDYLS